MKIGVHRKKELAEMDPGLRRDDENNESSRELRFIVRMRAKLFARKDHATPDSILR